MVLTIFLSVLLLHEVVSLKVFLGALLIVGGAPDEAVSEELELLNAQARELEATIASNVAQIFET